MTPLNLGITPSILETARDLGRLNGANFAVERPLHARIVSDLDQRFIKAKARAQALLGELIQAKQQLQELTNESVCTKNLRSEYPISLFWLILLSLFAAVALLGEVATLYETLGQATNLGDEESLLLALAVVGVLFSVKPFLQKWVLDKAFLSKKVADYPKVGMAFLGFIVITTIVGMYTAVGVFRAESLSWDDNKTFAIYMLEHRTEAIIVIGSITAGLFIGLMVWIAFLESQWKLRLVESRCKKLETRIDAQVAKVQLIEEEQQGLQELVEKWEVHYKPNVLQEWMVQAHTEFLKGVEICNATRKEQEKVAEETHVQVLSNELEGASLTELFEHYMEMNLKKAIRESQKSGVKKLTQFTASPINYSNGYAKKLNPTELNSL